ncbi:MAG: translocation/assembly module TamB domain-containing protein, partial [Deltaproteobacteria bacterium]|nr:translocation/assembly module TamB domain-containing protein [Deltaproteobacteria bacterium]
AGLGLHRVDLGRVAALAGRSDLRVTGVADGELELLPRRARGDVRLRAIWVPALGALGPLDARLRVVHDRDDLISPTLDVTLPNVGAVAARADVAVPARPFDLGAWRRAGAASLRGATITARDIVLDPGAFARFGIASQLRGRASLEVTVAAGLASARARLAIAQLRGTPLAKPVDATVDATLDRAAIAATASVRAPGASPLLELTGRLAIPIAQLHRDPRALRTAPLTGTLTVANASAPLLLQMVGRTELRGGSLAASATFGGTLAAPTVRARITGTSLLVPPQPGATTCKPLERLDVTADWDGRSGKLSIEGSERDGKLTFTASGSALATAKARVTATRFDLAPLLALAPGRAGVGTGILDGDLAVHGLDMRTARFAGEIRLSDARVPVAATIGTLRDANIHIVIGDRDAKISAHGKLGRGEVTGSGSLTLDGARIVGGSAKVKLRKITPIAAFEPLISGDLEAKLSRGSTHWVAEITARNGTVKAGPRSREKLKPIGAPADIVIGRPEVHKSSSMPSEQPPPPQPYLVTHFTLGNTEVETEEVRGRIHGKLTFTLDSERLGIVGTVEADRGNIDLFDRRYSLERGVLAFDGSTDPRLDIRIVHDFSDVTTVTEVGGRLSKPRLNLSASPSIYTETQLLGFLLGGEPGGDPSSASAGERITSTGASLVANTLGSYLRRALPFEVDVLRYEAETVRSSAALTVGSWLTGSLFFAFRQHLDTRPDENSSEGTVQYWLTLRTQIEATIGDRGFDGVDILWRKRW